MLPTTAGWVAHKPPSDFIFSERLEERKAPFEIKLTTVALVLYAFPICALVLLDSKPTVQKLFGRWALHAALGLISWLLVCHFFLARGILRRGMAAIMVFALPSAVLAGVCQVHAWEVQQKAAALVSTDCSSFLQKAALARAWQAASTFRQACMAQDANITGLSAEQETMVQDLLQSFSHVDMQQCSGYADAQAKHDGAWQYLTYLESNYHCGGWCRPHAPIFVPYRVTQDSCSLAIGRALAGDISLLDTQVTLYSLILFFCACFLLLVSPRSLAAAW